MSVQGMQRWWLLAPVNSGNSSGKSCFIRDVFCCLFFLKPMLHNSTCLCTLSSFCLTHKWRNYRSVFTRHMKLPGCLPERERSGRRRSNVLCFFGDDFSLAWDVGTSLSKSDSLWQVHPFLWYLEKMAMAHSFMVGKGLLKPWKHVLDKAEFQSLFAYHFWRRWSEPSWRQRLHAMEDILLAAAADGRLSIGSESVHRHDICLAVCMYELSTHCLFPVVWGRLFMVDGSRCHRQSLQGRAFQHMAWAVWPKTAKLVRSWRLN